MRRSPSPDTLVFTARTGALNLWGPVGGGVGGGKQTGEGVTLR